MIEQAHADRDHFEWAASSTAANWTCSGRMAMATLAVEQPESIHAARGTAAHEISERCLNSTALTPIDFKGEVVKTKEHSVIIDDELISSAEVYVNYVRGLKADLLMIEKKYSLAALNPPFGAGGTTDAAAIFYAQRMMEIVDLKNGMGVVEVNENKQTRTYALTVLLNLGPTLAAAIDTIKVTIVQPRAPHEDGRIRSETFHVSDLLDWAYELLQRMNMSKAALDAFNTLNGSREEFLAWCDIYLTPGNCTFCPAEGICPALKKQALAITSKAAVAWFENPDAPVPDLTLPTTLSDAELEHMLNGLSMLEDWVKAVRSLAHARAERGTKFERWQLSDKIGLRTYIDKSNQAALAAQLKTLLVTVDETLMLTDEQVFETPEVKSLAQLEKLPGGVGAKIKKALTKLEGKLWHKPITGTNLVQKDKTERPAVGSTAERNFESPSE